MSLSAAVLEALLAEGIEASAIVRIAKAAEAEDAARIEQKRAGKRAGNAERQRRFKANKKATELTPNNAGNADNAVTPSPNDIYSNPQPTLSDESVSRSRGPAKPEGVEDQVWNDFKQLRTKQKAPITATALAGIEREARKAGLTTNAALRETVERNWRGFKAEWVQRDQAAPSRDPPSHLAFLSAQRRQQEEWARSQGAGR